MNAYMDLCTELDMANALLNAAPHSSGAKACAVESGTTNADRACDPTGVLDIANPAREDSADAQ